jgi:hypothetical protein
MATNVGRFGVPMKFPPPPTHSWGTSADRTLPADMAKVPTVATLKTKLLSAKGNARQTDSKQTGVLSYTIKDRCTESCDRNVTFYSAPFKNPSCRLQSSAGWVNYDPKTSYVEILAHVMLCSDVVGYQRFGEPSCIHLHWAVVIYSQVF